MIVELLNSSHRSSAEYTIGEGSEDILKPLSQRNISKSIVPAIVLVMFLCMYSDRPIDLHAGLSVSSSHYLN